MGKIKDSHGDRIRKPGALHKQIKMENDAVRKKHGRNRAKRLKKDQEEKVEQLDILTSKESERIIRAARLQQEELNVDEAEDLEVLPMPSLDIDLTGTAKESDDEINLQEVPIKFEDTLTEQVNEDDERILSAFMSRNPLQRRTLADIIQEKLDEKREQLSREAAGDSIDARIDADVVKLYRQVGQVLARYRSGKLPKAFKALPALENWETLVAYTHPENWTAASMFQATRIFASKLNNKLAEKFYFTILMPRIRDDIAAYKKLNQHLTMAVRKATIKPAAFFKGIIFPICAAGDCTLREAVILGSIISRCSIPVLHCGAALYKLCSMEYSGGTSLFIRMLLEKRYALHYRVIDILVEHFVRFREEPRLLPVIWHQSLLSFVEGYRRDLDAKQVEALLDLISHQRHHKISPVIKAQLKGQDGNDVVHDTEM